MEEGRRQYVPQEGGVTVLDYWRALWKRKWLIVALCLASMLASLVYSWRQPKLYVASATILSPKEAGVGIEGSGMTFALEGLNIAGSGRDRPMGLFSFGIPAPNKVTYLAILRSRTMREGVVQRLGSSLGPLVESHSMEVAERDGTMVLTVWSRDPNLSAQLANYYFEHLIHRLASMARDTLKVRQNFYLGQLEKTSKDFKEAQEALIQFQEKHRVVLSPSAERRIAAEAGGAATVATLEMELALMRMYLTDQHPDVIAAKRRIYEAKRLLSYSLYGEPKELPPENEGAPPRKEYFVATAKQLPLQFRLAEVYRTFKFREGIYNTNVTNLEMGKYVIDELPPLTSIEWVDKAIVPSGHSKPNIQYNVGAAGVGSLVIGIILALFLEYLDRVRAWDRISLTEARTAAHRGEPAAELSDGPLHLGRPPAGPAGSRQLDDSR